jgi:hypothetical protein
MLITDIYNMTDKQLRLRFLFFQLFPYFCTPFFFRLFEIIAIDRNESLLLLNFKMTIITILINLNTNTNSQFSLHSLWPLNNYPKKYFPFRFLDRSLLCVCSRSFLFELWNVFITSIIYCRIRAFIWFDSARLIGYMKMRSSRFAFRRGV